MTIRTTINVILALAVLLVIGNSDAPAAVVTPVSATASSRFFTNAQDDPANLLGPGLTVASPIENSTHENSNWNALPNTGWFTGEAGDPTPHVDFDLGGTFTVGEAHIWNWNGSTAIGQRK